MVFLKNIQGFKEKVILKEGRESCLEETSDFSPYSSLLVFCRWKEKITLSNYIKLVILDS